MSELIDIPKIKVKVKDVFSVPDLIRNLTEWLQENGYLNLDGISVEQNNQETLYTHKIQGGNFLDLWMWWRMLKYPMDTTDKTSYVRYRLNVDMHYLGDAVEVEVMHKGKKVKLNKGEISIDIAPYLEIDFRNEWEKKGILKLVKDVFRKKIYKKEIEEHLDYLYSQAYKFQALIKQYFKLEGTMPEETVSNPPKGLM